MNRTVLWSLLWGLVLSSGCFSRREPVSQAGQCAEDCAANELCIGGECRAACSVSSECDAGEGCVDGACTFYEGERCDESSRCLEGFWCDSGLCRKLTATGLACERDSECERGSCVDGVCCNSPCNRACLSCAASLTGDIDGRCVATALGRDPRDECAGVTTCDGVGGCTRDLGEACLDDIECQSGFCVDGVCCGSACDGTCVACSAALTGGTDGVCTSTRAGEERGDECAGAVTCAGDGSCFDKGLGESCSFDYECTSGSCADGVCCDSQCDGSCEACNASGACVGVTNADDPDTCGPAAASGECPAGVPCTCDASATCKASGNATCSTDGDCATGNCYEVPGTSPVVKFCCDRACDGPCETCGSNGVCVALAAGAAPEKGSCPGEALCDGTGQCHDSANGTGCASDFECLSGVCDQASGVCCNEDCTASACFTCNGLGGPGQCVTVSGDPGNICPGEAQCGDDLAGDGCWAKTGGETRSGNEQCISGECCNGRCLFGWQEVPTPTTQDLNDVYVASPTAAWAVGDNGTLLEWDGVQWRLVTTGTTARLVAVHGFGESHIVAATNQTELLRKFGSTWTSVSPPLPASHLLSDVYVASANEYFLIAAGSGTPRSSFGRFSTTWQFSSSSLLDQGLFRHIDGNGTDIAIALETFPVGAVCDATGIGVEALDDCDTVAIAPVSDVALVAGTGLSPYALSPDGTNIIYGLIGSSAGNPFNAIEVATVGTSMLAISTVGVISRLSGTDWSTVADLGRAVVAIDAADSCSGIVVGPSGLIVHQ